MTPGRSYRAAPDLLRDRVILITGAGDGLGRAAALAFARYGASVVLLGRTIAKLERVYDNILESGGTEPALYPMDLSGANDEDYRDLAETLRREIGRLDALLHSATLLGTLTPLSLYDPKLWYRVMQVNLHAPFLMTKACLPLLKTAPDPTVVFTNCSVGRRGRAYWGAYGVSKFGISGLTEIWADELENSGIRVNGVDPGPVRTSLRARAYPGEDASLLATPESVMPLYLYLVGPDSKGVTGQTLSALPEATSEQGAAAQ